MSHAERAGLEAAVPNRSASRPRRRAVLLALAGLLAAAGAGGGYVAASGGPAAAHARRGGVPLLASRGGTIPTIEATLAAELSSQRLHYTHIACVPNGRSWHGRPIVRCNVDFGDPHIEAYCSVVRNGRLLTNFDDPSIPCGHDGAGFTIIAYPPSFARTIAKSG